MISLRLTGLDWSPAVALLPETRTPLPAKILAGSDHKLTLEITLNAKRMLIELDRGERITGSAECDGARGTAEFVQTVVTATQPSWSGICRNADSFVLVHPFFEFGGGLFLSNVATGEMGALHPTAPDSALLAATVATPVLPERAGGTRRNRHPAGVRATSARHRPDLRLGPRGSSRAGSVVHVL